MRNAILFICAMLLGMIFISAITTWLMPVRIVEFDINDTVSQFHYNIGQTDLSNEKRETEIRRFTDTLQQVVNDYAVKNKVVVLVSPAVVSGAKDVSHDIQQALLAALKAQNDSKHEEVGE